VVSEIYDCTQELLGAPKIGEIPSSEGLVEIELREEVGETGIATDRLQILLSSLIELHSVLARLFEVPDDKLTFRYFDSGTNISAGATCASQVAEAMNKFVVFLNSVRFWKQAKFDRNMLSFSNALDLRANIDSQIKAGSITPDEGERYKASLIAEAEKLTGIGAGIPARLTDQEARLRALAGSRRLITGETSD
jgi:hypothetical protein